MNALPFRSVCISDRQDDLFRVRPFRATELERREAVAVLRAIRIRRVGFQVRAHHPADLAMRDGAFADEFDAGAQNEIAFHFFPREMELVRTEPHVRARAGERVLLAGGVVTGRTGELGRADVAVPVELPERIILSRRWRNESRHDDERC